MNTIPTELVNEEKNTDGVHEADGLVELGAVSSETKSGFIGSSHDTGFGVIFP
jgi:hypothetical protein